MRKIESSGNTARNVIEFPRRSEVASKRFFDNHARIFGQVCGTEAFDYVSKSAGELPGSAPDAEHRRAPS